MSQSARIAQRVRFYLLDSANNTAVNAVQTHTLSGVPTGGTFTVSYSGVKNPRLKPEACE